MSEISEALSGIDREDIDGGCLAIEAEKDATIAQLTEQWSMMTLLP